MHTAQSTTSANAGQRGFGMAELLAALVVLAIVAAVAVFHRQNLNADAVSDGEIVKSALRAARTRAMADNVPWAVVVAGQAATLSRNGVNREVFALATQGVAAGTTTFDNRGRPSGTLSYTVTNYPGSPVTVTQVTGLVP